MILVIGRLRLCVVSLIVIGRGRGGMLWFVVDMVVVKVWF